MRILLDVMGGDLPPGELVAGGVAAGCRHSIDILFVGDPEIIRTALRGLGETAGGRFEVVPSSEVIRMDDPPVRAVREKRGSSLLVGLTALKSGIADAFVSPGNTGAVVAGSLFTLGRVPGIPRPGLLAVLPSLRNQDFLVIDVGANSDCAPEHLEAFALMGASYARSVLGIAYPTVGLLNIGEEDTKGNRVANETFAILRNGPLPFAGNVEPHLLLTERPVDVVVCDGFVGNIFLKSIEGGISAFSTLLRRSVLRNALTKAGAFLLRRSFADMRQVFSYKRRGGAPLLGVNGVVVIAHGRSDAEAIGGAIDVARRQAEAHLVQRFSKGLEGWALDGG
jgi:glycerol-3-phosphate acyltransferase PlsX